MYKPGMSKPFVVFSSLLSPSMPLCVVCGLPFFCDVPLFVLNSLSSRDYLPVVALLALSTLERYYVARVELPVLLLLASSSSSTIRWPTILEQLLLL